MDVQTQLSAEIGRLQQHSLGDPEISREPSAARLDGNSGIEPSQQLPPWLNTVGTVLGSVLGGLF